MQAMKGEMDQCNELYLEIHVDKQGITADKLFNVCFYSGCIPDVWYKGI